MDIVDLTQASSLHNSADFVFIPRNTDQLTAFLAQYPHSSRIQLGDSVKIPFHHDFTDTEKARLESIAKDYEIIANYALNAGGKKIYLGHKNPRVCRYCGSTNKALFRKIAHAIPEQIGNKTLFDYSECDTCNATFSEMLEDHFAKWTNPLRTMGRVPGKRGVPTTKSRDSKIRIESKDNKNLNMYIHEGDERLRDDDDNKRVSITLERQPYIPMGVFKCMVKMAIAIMPHNDGADVSHLKQWILERTHTYESYPYKPLMIFSQFVPGSLPNDRIACFLLRRKAGVVDRPFFMFVLQFSQVIYQIVLPMHKEDQQIMAAGRATIPVFPNPWGTVSHETQYGASNTDKNDMSGTERTAAPITLTFKYDTRIPRSQDDKKI